MSGVGLKVKRYEDNLKSLDEINGSLESIKKELPDNKIYLEFQDLIKIVQKTLDDLILFKNEYNRDFLKEDSILNSFVESQLSTINNNINNIFSYLSGIVVNSSQDGFINLFNELEKNIFILKKIIIDYLASSDMAKEIYEQGFKISLNNIKDVLQEIDLSREFILNKKTKTIYSEARKINEIRFKNNQRNFFLVLAITLVISIFLFFSYKFGWIKMDFWDYILMKFIFLAVGITLITYFLRHASIYRKKADQAEQTHLELTAFPSYVIGMDAHDLSSLKKDLAIKYFGKEVEAEPYNKIGDLVQEQLKISLEMVKASSEVIKNVNAGGNSKSSQRKEDD